MPNDELIPESEINIDTPQEVKKYDIIEQGLLFFVGIVIAIIYDLKLGIIYAGMSSFTMLLFLFSYMKDSSEVGPFYVVGYGEGIRKITYLMLGLAIGLPVVIFLSKFLPAAGIIPPLLGAAAAGQLQLSTGIQLLFAFIIIVLMIPRIESPFYNTWMGTLWQNYDKPILKIISVFSFALFFAAIHFTTYLAFQTAGLAINIIPSLMALYILRLIETLGLVWSGSHSISMGIHHVWNFIAFIAIAAAFVS